MNILAYLTQPFPKAENKWKTIIQISLFVTLFLFVFQPFGIGQIESSSIKSLFIGGFGIVSFIVMVIDLLLIERIFSRFFNEKNWYVYKELFWLLCIVSSIGLGNALYAISFSNRALALEYIVNYQIVTFAVALLPICIFTLAKQNYLLKKHTTTAKDTNENLKPTVPQKNQNITIYSYNENTKEEFDINQLYFIESQGNDISLYLYEDNILVNKKLRNTLKNTLAYLTDSPELAQCHRAFIVNLNKVEQVEGNSQGLVLKFTDSDAEVPVSRSFVSTIKHQLSIIT